MSNNYLRYLKIPFILFIPKCIGCIKIKIQIESIHSKLKLHLYCTSWKKKLKIKKNCIPWLMQNQFINYFTLWKRSDDGWHFMTSRLSLFNVNFILDNTSNKNENEKVINKWINLWRSLDSSYSRCIDKCIDVLYSNVIIQQFTLYLFFHL